MDLLEIRKVVARCAFQNWRFVVGADGPRPYLQVEFDAPCNTDGGEPKPQRGRKWLLSRHMTRSELVQTAFKAVLTALEHEAREQFLYAGRAIFGPHFDVNELWKLAGRPDAEERRAERDGMPMGCP